MLAARPAFPLRQPERLVFHGRSIGALLFSGLHPPAHLPSERQVAADIGLRPAHPAPALILRHPGGLRPGIRHSGRTHRTFMGTNFRRTTRRHVLGNRTREPLGGTTGQSGLGLGQRTSVPDGGPIPLRTAHRPTGLVPERKPESVEQDTLRSLGCIFPAVRAWQHVAGLHQQSVRADPAEPCGKFFV